MMRRIDTPPPAQSLTRRQAYEARIAAQRHAADAAAIRARYLETVARYAPRLLALIRRQAR